MADVLIKDVEMPKCCIECEWYTWYDSDYYGVHACRKTGTMPIDNAETERAEDCPLVELPPHGRLIDENDLHIKDTDGLLETGRVWDAPTILEASK